MSTLKTILYHAKKGDLIRSTISRIIRNNGVIETEDNDYIEKLHKKYMEVLYLRHPKLDNPQTFREKMVYLKLNYRNPLLTICADKIKAKEYINDTLGFTATPHTLRVFDDIEKLDLSGLPDTFVIKNNHASGDVFICKKQNNEYVFYSTSNEKVSKETVIATLKKQLQKNYYYKFYEWQYKDIEPCSFAEEYIGDIDDLRDYKIFVNYGKVIFFYVTTDRKTELKMNAFYGDKTPIPIDMTYPRNKKGIELPNNMDEMLCIAKKLGSQFPLVRVDLYDVNGKINCGELTFSADGGFPGIYPYKYDEILGNLIDISEIK